MEKIQLENSDVISFHSYEPADEFERRVKSLTHYGRPILCTEYMARPRGSTFESILPVAKKYKVGAINWGFVQGKTQTYLPWDSWQHSYVEHPPEVWFHPSIRTGSRTAERKWISFGGSRRSRDTRSILCHEDRFLYFDAVRKFGKTAEVSLCGPAS
jgi:hypothetical protein